MSELTKMQDNEEFKVLVSGTNELEALRANLGEGGIEPGSLDKIKMPGSGGKFFEIPDVSGERSESNFKGIIVNWQDVRAYWKDAFAGEQAPDCNSFDMQKGVGTPGGECATCPMNEWGSADNSNAKACKEKRKLLILMEGQIFRVYMDAPTMSLAPLKKYFQQLASKNIPFHSVVTEFGLKQEENAGGIKYSRLNVVMDRSLTVDEVKGLASYSQTFESAMRGN